MTEQSIGLRVMELLHLPETELPRLITLIPIARRKLSLEVNSILGREALRGQFTLTISSGAASLTTALAASEPLLLDTVRLANITSASSSYRWQWVANRSMLAIQTVGDFIHYTLEGSTIYTDSPDATATMEAGIEASLSTIEMQGLDDDLVQMIAILASGTEAQAA